MAARTPVVFDHMRPHADPCRQFDADGNGTLDPQEFNVLAVHLKLDELLAAMPSQLGESRDQLDPWVVAAFGRFDSNGDGVLDKEEVASMLDVVGFEASDSYVAQAVTMFGQYDRDGNGTLDVSEFGELAMHLNMKALNVAGVEQWIVEAFRHFDTNGDNLLDTGEVAGKYRARSK